MIKRKKNIDHFTKTAEHYKAINVTCGINRRKDDLVERQ